MRDQNGEIHEGVAPRQGNPAEQLQALLERVERLPANGARELTDDCIRSLLEFYGQGLARILQLIGNSGDGGKTLDLLLRDKMVSSLLLVHDLHPLDLETRLRGALDQNRPYMESHGGNIELIGIFDGVARVRFEGSCKGCPSSAMTMELAVRRAVEEACPDLAGLELEGTEALPTAPARECELEVEA